MTGAEKRHSYRQAYKKCRKERLQRIRFCRYVVKEIPRSIYRNDPLYRNLFKEKSIDGFEAFFNAYDFAKTIENNRTNSVFVFDKQFGIQTLVTTCADLTREQYNMINSDFVWQKEGF